MSYGFGIGDFIAVGELSWKLYRSVYQVARDAPAEIGTLVQDLSNLHSIIQALREDASQAGSAVSQAPEDRVELGRSLLKATEENLRALEKLVDKYLPLGEPPTDPKSRRETIKRLLKRIKYSSITREINDIRAKIHYNAGLLNLLLLAAGNSSLERIQEQNEKLSRNVEHIKASIQNPSHAQKNPTLTCSYDEQSQYKLTRAFMTQAEVKGMPWAAIGIESWIQVGKWWLMKAQAGLGGSIQGHCQAYADLLKASWILTDVISIHPQLSFLTSGQQQLDIEHLSRVVKLEHERLASSSFARPSVDRIMASDLTMWEKDLKTNLLPPIDRAKGRDLAMWNSDSGNVLFQRFGRYVSTSTGTEEECVILLVDKPGNSLTLIAQSAYGSDIVVGEPTHGSVGDDEDSGWHSLTLADGDSQQKFQFLNQNDARLLLLLIRGIIEFRSLYRVEGLNLRTLRAVALLHCLSTQCDDDIRLLTHLEETDTKASDDPGDLWNIAFILSQQPTSLAPRYLSHLWRQSPGEIIMPIGVLSWILWAKIPVSTRLAALDTVLPQWQSEYVGEAHQATIMSRDLQLLRAVVRCTILPQGDTGPESMDSIESILLRYASHFKSRNSSVNLLLSSLISGCPNSVTVMMKSGANETIHDHFDTIRDVISATMDTAVCELFLRYVGPFLRKDVTDDLWFLAQRMCCSTGIKYIALESAQLNKSRGQIRLIPAVIGGDVAFIKALQLQLGFFSVNKSFLERDDYLRIVGDFKRRRHAPWFREIANYAWGNDQWPHWPLLIAIRLAHGIELIAHLISSGAWLWYPKSYLHDTKSEPLILQLIRNWNSLRDARLSYCDSHKQLRNILKRKIESTYGLRYTWKSVQPLALSGEMMGLGVKRRGPRMEVDGPYQYFPDLPVSLQTEANFVKWKRSLISLLEKATDAQRKRPVSKSDDCWSELSISLTAEDSSASE